MNRLAPMQFGHRLLGSLAPSLSARLARHQLLTPRRHAPRDWEHAALATAEPVTFRFGLAGLRWGGAGPVVLMLHGWEGRPSQFAAFVPPLLAAGRQVISLAAPAHDGGPLRQANVLLFAQALLEAGSELRDIEAVLGHSMGGAAALLALRLGLSAPRVATLASPSALAAALDRYARSLALPPRAHCRFRKLVDERVGIPADCIDIALVAAGLRLPALIAHDRNDAAVPFAEAERITAAMPYAQLLATRGLGHSRILTEPTVVDEVVAFLLAEPSTNTAITLAA